VGQAQYKLKSGVSCPPKADFGRERQKIFEIFKIA